MKVTVSDACTGCGLCIDICPELFDLGDDEVAFAKLSEVPDELADACREAAETCPTSAIEIDE